MKAEKVPQEKPDIMLRLSYREAQLLMLLTVNVKWDGEEVGKFANALDGVIYRTGVERLDSSANWDGELMIEVEE